jgi:hypothetical protein
LNFRVIKFEWEKARVLPFKGRLAFRVSKKKKKFTPRKKVLWEDKKKNIEQNHKKEKTTSFNSISSSHGIIYIFIK